MAQTYEARLRRVLDHVYDNLDGDLSLDTLADVAALSRFHFHRVFSAMTGESVAGFTRRVRLYRAAHELLESDRDVDQIAAQCGYPNPRSFSRAFRDGFGLTPLAFRARGVPRAPLDLSQKDIANMYDVTLTDEPDRRLATIPHRGSFLNIGKAFETAGTTVMSRGLAPHLGPMVGVYFDDPAVVAEADMRSAAGFVITGDVAIDPPLEEIALEGGKYAILRYVGPYPGLPAAYEYLYGSWLPQSNETPRHAPPFELYENSPMDTAPDDLVTLICLPLE